MTEAEWQSCGDPHAMLDFLDAQASPRKLRLLACACCRRLWTNLSSEARRSVETAELFADRKVGPKDLRGARGPCYSGLRADNSASFAAAPSQSFRRYARTALLHAAWSAGWPSWVERVRPETEAAEKVAQAMLVRDIFGNPFQPVSIARTWLAWNLGTVRKMAQAIYDDRRFDDLPILADALEEADCMDSDILSHCRASAAHVRGCRVLDALLGKS
ncbi:MAG TPA: hypothetical protein VH643_06210 [Gemmataceae bacterium]|jgi:hypothetical protein